jgi:ribonuclease I
VARSRGLEVVTKARWPQKASSVVNDSDTWVSLEDSLAQRLPEASKGSYETVPPSNSVHSLY